MLTEQEYMSPMKGWKVKVSLDSGLYSIRTSPTQGCYFVELEFRNQIVWMRRVTPIDGDRVVDIVDRARAAF